MFSYVFELIAGAVNDLFSHAEILYAPRKYDSNRALFSILGISNLFSHN